MSSRNASSSLPTAPFNGGVVARPSVVQTIGSALNQVFDADGNLPGDMTALLEALDAAPVNPPVASDQR